MKDWQYYREPEGIPHFGWNEEQAYKQQLTEEINNSPMTAAERDAALADVKRRVREHAAEQNKPYREAKAKLEAEFWADARAELGYDDFLTDEGVKALEHKAYEDGHSSGHSEVFGCLQDLASLAETLVKCVK